MVALTVFKFTARKKIKLLENKENVRFFRFKENKIFHQSTDEEEKFFFLPFLITVKQFSSNYYTQVMWSFCIVSSNIIEKTWKRETGEKIIHEKKLATLSL